MISMNNLGEVLSNETANVNIDAPKELEKMVKKKDKVPVLLKS